MVEYLVFEVKGLSQAGYWSETKAWSLSGKVFDAARVLVVVGNGEQVVNLESEAKVVLDRIEDFLKKFDGDFGEIEKELVKECGDLVGKLEPLTVELVLVCFKNQEVFMLALGGSVSLYRNGVLGRVLDGESGICCVRGEVCLEDVMFLSSKRMWGVFGYSRLQELFEKSLEGGGLQGLSGMAEEMVVELSNEGLDFAAGMLVGILELKRPVVGEWRKKLSGVNVAWFVKVIPKRNVYVLRKPGGTRRKRLFLLMLVLFLLFGLSLGWGYLKNRQSLREEEVALVIDPVRSMYDEAVALKGVNRLRSRALLENALGDVKLALGAVGKDKKLELVYGEWLEKLEKEFALVSGEERVSLSVYLDLGLVREGFFGSVMSVFDGSVLVWDGGSRSLLEVGLDFAAGMLVGILELKRPVVGEWRKKLSGVNE